MLFKISIKYYITIIFSLFSFVKRYAVRNDKIRQYAVRRVKIRQYAVRKGGGGVTLIKSQTHAGYAKTNLIFLSETKRGI